MFRSVYFRPRKNKPAESGVMILFYNHTIKTTTRSRQTSPCISTIHTHRAVDFVTLTPFTPPIVLHRRLLKTSEISLET